ncbi:MAG: hypothetical protein A3K19_08435 [Lentisphaerae bacterium RIFOXYB12_FULL_65_16]|nr:MAG: hypothetical protein A3K18_24270 [Lentisphaerae bacterium RIFOXYA12_64_32]OGV90323.1 MAG: hypothetical protein A3K19_08435 [Lentisphaerae bacterium RIFOXYB12_FULL_65_16]
MKRPPKQPIVFFSSSVPVYVAWLRGKPGGGFPLAYHPEFEFHLVKRGRGVYRVDGRNWEFGPSSLVCIRPNQVHSHKPDSATLMEKAQLLFKGDWVADAISALRLDKTFPSVIPLSDRFVMHFEMILNRILEENVRWARGWERMTHALLIEFLLWAKRAGEQPVQSHEERPLFLQLRQYMESQYHDPRCNVTQIAKQFGYSQGYLSTVFRAASGVSPGQYLIQYRISAARQMLREAPGWRIESIAAQVGFSQYRSFARAFYRLVGVSPAAYRRNCLVHLGK